MNDSNDALQQDKANLDELGEVRDPTEALAAWSAARGISAHQVKADGDAKKSRTGIDRVRTLLVRLGRWTGTVEALDSAHFPETRVRAGV